jgi:hypothetical protein
MMHALLKKVCMKVSRNGLCYRDKCYQKKSNVWSKATYVSTCAGWVNIIGCREVGKVYLSFVVGAGAYVSFVVT